MSVYLSCSTHKKTTAVMILELLFTTPFIKNFSDEKYSGTTPPTSPNSLIIQDAGDPSVLRCTLWTFQQIANKPNPKCQLAKSYIASPKFNYIVLKRWMDRSNIMEIAPNWLVC